ncbi:acyl-CoA thioesterase [Allofrancisella guangzhouensis]|uniref:Thioesterase n=1 Tax=Allofrancisella guangzhouensis TaxID=594679 RepID=A0A0A8EAJ4_9GAMM|nr:thioesterase family protein [Allofrancisella guangzhouensis]AJC49186.1 thioesterase [Allofrancisella guangzhouensis]MBK2026643.1 acyl-CoA thioesterase [Allofrancisella guangzhouensis]MBK2044426.1 acyl-CoA thioesterase [Allofrancisella guangzhouensis]MBK2045366.1 acyl-CoA thioesterase [Allofrancisella guangzhouensis]
MNIKPFQIITNIRWSDTDKNGHVNNGKYFDYFEEARTEWVYSFKKLINWSLKNSIQFVIAEQSCKYILPLLHPNKIEITQYVLKIGVASIEFRYELRIPGNGKIITTAHTKLACYNLKTARLEKIPNDIKQAILENHNE